jgi:hypothetical protein
MSGDVNLQTANNKFALLSYETVNLGDEIQSLAAAQFLPRVDAYINREQMNQFVPADEQIHRLLLNGWFMHNPRNWPPSKFIEPLIISFHLNSVVGEAGIAPNSAMLSGAGIEYLKKFSPIGARDTSTLALLEAAGVDAYFSGCLTLTLPRPSVSRDDDLIVVNDIPALTLRHLKSCTKKRVWEADQNTADKNRLRRFSSAYKLLETYARASFVVTTRLHCALPSLAFGTPVLFLKADRDALRFEGLDTLLNSCSVADFLTYETSRIDNPAENPTRHLSIRQRLIETVEKFSGKHGCREQGPFHSVFGVEPHLLQVVEAAYRGILHRDPDEEGFLVYSTLLKREGLTGGTEKMIRQMLISPECEAMRHKSVPHQVPLP